MNTYDHFKKYEWLGEFWLPKRKRRFPGKLSYNPEDGVVLECLYSKVEQSFWNSKQIFGLLETGEFCSVFCEKPCFLNNNEINRLIHSKFPCKSVVFSDQDLRESNVIGLQIEFSNFSQLDIKKMTSRSCTNNKMIVLNRANKDGVHVDFICEQVFKKIRFSS